MRKEQVFKSVVVIQALCFIVLTVVVVTHVWTSPEGAVPPDNDKDSGGESGIAATVGGEPIHEAEFQKELRKQYGESVLRSMMVHAAIRLESAANNISVSDEELDDELDFMMAGYMDEEQYYAAMKSQLGMSPQYIREDTEYRLLLEKIAIRSIQVSELEVDAYMADNPDLFKPLVTYRLAWIVVPSKRDANAILKKLTAGADFESMARTYSKDEDTADSGGDLGVYDADDPFFERGVLDAAGELDVGDITGPISVNGGQAVIRLLEKKETRQMDKEKQRITARRQLALTKAASLQIIEEELLSKYEAQVAKAS